MHHCRFSSQQNQSLRYASPKFEQQDSTNVVPGGYIYGYLVDNALALQTTAVDHSAEHTYWNGSDEVPQQVCDGVTRIVGVLELSTSVVITQATKSLTVQFKVTGNTASASYVASNGSGTPEWFGSGAFSATFLVE